MTTLKPTAEGGQASDSKPAMTVQEAIKRVKRVTVHEDKGQTRTVTAPLKEKEVLAFKDYGSHVVVVTVDGQKFSNAPAAAAAAAAAEAEAA